YSESGPGLANGPPPNVAELPVGAPSQSSYNDNSAPLPAPAPAPGPAPVPPPAPAPLPAPAEGGEYQQSSSDNAYEEISGDHDKAPDTEASIGTYEGNGGSASASGPAPAPLPASNPESANVYEQSAGAEAVGSENNYEEANVAPPLPPSAQANEYGDETNAAMEPVNVEAEGAACEDPELKAIVENALNSESDNLEAARKIEGNASKKFGGRFNSIVSDSEFAYVNWYGKRNCQLRVRNRHSLTWED
ncbi:unnamed protein product, partial [Toxocara canis]|uniref:Ground-like domain-containing protein n=1 Tax=Toxocara canis TaxID=6265 RepID=A0A183UR62_TOXCA